MSTPSTASAPSSAASGLWSRARGAFSRAATPAAGALPAASAVREALFDDDGRLMRASSVDYASLPDGVLELRLALEAKIHRLAEKRSKKDPTFKSILDADAEAAYRIISTDADADIQKAFDDVYGSGKTVPSLAKEWMEYRDKIVDHRRTAGIIPMEFFSAAAASPPAAAAPVVSTPPAPAAATAAAASTPAPVVSRPVAVVTPGGINWSDLGSVDSETLLLDLAEGLEYDRFDSMTFRSKIFSRAEVPNLQELIVMCTTYIFVGNNTTRLTSKVKNQKIGERALAVCNKFGVMRQKADSLTVTLARIGIAFSPIVWALRSELERVNKLAAAGVITTTPVVMQDVALSGVSNKIDGGAAIEDFLVKFNRVLSEAAEKGKQSKSTESDRDATAKKFHGVSLTGAARDPLIQSWDFNKKRTIKDVEEFYSLVRGM